MPVADCCLGLVSGLVSLLGFGSFDCGGLGVVFCSGGLIASWVTCVVCGCCVVTLVDLVVSLLRCCICVWVGGVSGCCCCAEVVLVMVCLDRCVALIMLLYCMV